MIKNLTPHNITVFLKDGSSLFLPSEEQSARVNSDTRTELNREGDLGVPVVATFFFEVTDLPNQQENTFYIVSRMVMDAVKRNSRAYGEREDLLVPHDLVRDEMGAIIGCKGFSVN